MSRTVCRNSAELTSADHAGAVFFLCDRCHLIKPVQRSGGTGYGYLAETDRPVCYACFGQLDRDRMRSDDKAILYLRLSGAGHSESYLSNWPCTFSIRTTSVERMGHPFAREAWLVRFVGPDGRKWSGRNIGDSQITHCRVLRSKRRA